MRSVLAAFVLCSTTAAAHGQTKLRPSAPLRLQVVHADQRSSRPPLSFRSVDYVTERESGIVAAIPVADNATIGIGRFTAPPRRRVSVQDQPVRLDAPKSRRAAVGLTLRF